MASPLSWPRAPPLDTAKGKVLAIIKRYSGWLLLDFRMVASFAFAKL
jgi:hypothetical protein